jgi:hypothetical protein
MGDQDQEKKRRGQLHEVLSVDRDLEQRDQTSRGEAIQILAQSGAFRGFVKTLTMFKEEDKCEEAANSETSVITYTVEQIFDAAFGESIKYVDAVAQKERTNQEARADIVLEDGTVIVRDVPATVLLSLERQVVEWRKGIQAAPVLSAGLEWEDDADLGKGIYKNKHDIKRLRTKNVKVPIELSPATNQHPAQVQLADDTITTGEYVEQHWSAMLKPARKIELLTRINDLSNAIKKARMRANKTEIVHIAVGEPIFEWLLK